MYFSAHFKSELIRGKIVREKGGNSREFGRISAVAIKWRENAVCVERAWLGSVEWQRHPTSLRDSSRLEVIPYKLWAATWLLPLFLTKSPEARCFRRTSHLPSLRKSLAQRYYFLNVIRLAAPPASPSLSLRHRHSHPITQPRRRQSPGAPPCPFGKGRERAAFSSPSSHMRS